MRTYEFQKRRTVDPDLLKGPAIRVTHGAVRAQERVFDPVVQRFRDPDVRPHHWLHRKADIFHGSSFFAAAAYTLFLSIGVETMHVLASIASIFKLRLFPRCVVSSLNEIEA